MINAALVGSSQLLYDVQLEWSDQFGIEQPFVDALMDGLQRRGGPSADRVLWTPPLSTPSFFYTTDYHAFSASRFRIIFSDC